MCWERKKVVARKGRCGQTGDDVGVDAAIEVVIGSCQWC